MHPDFFAAAPQAARDLAGRNSARLNDAYATLLDPARRTEWILTDRGAPSAQAERTMPQSFLMQVLEWNETLDSARETQGAARTSALQSLLTELSPQREALLVRLGSLLDPLPAPGSPALLAARRELNALAYLDRALAQIESLRLSA
jgi:DnaJ-domain-containing protein 1